MNRWIALEGRVKPLKMVQAPLSGERCVLYLVKLTLLQRLIEGELSGLSSVVAGSSFLILSHGREILVEPQRAQLKLRYPMTRRIRLGRDPDTDSRLISFYDALSRQPPRQTVRCQEYRLQTEDRIWLYGVLTTLPDARGEVLGYREPPRRALVRATELRVLGRG